MNKVKKWIPPVIPIRDDLPTWKTLFTDVHDNLIEAGLVQTEHPGQLDIDAVTELPADGTFAGHRIYRFNDALQATSPIFLKIQFGCGIEGLYSSGGSYRRSRTPRIGFSIGTGIIDGDTLINESNVFQAPQTYNYNDTRVGGDNDTYGMSYFCYNEDQGFLGFFYGVGSRNNPVTYNSGAYHGSTLAFVIQRDIDESGTPIDGGVVIWGPRLTGGNISFSDGWPVSVMQYISHTAGVGQLTDQAALRAFGLQNINPEDDIYFHPVYFVTTENIVKQWPSVVTCRNSDIAAGSEFQLDMQGFSPRNFLAIGENSGFSVDQISRQYACPVILFEGD